MIRLDYTISSLWYSVSAPRMDFANLDRSDLEGEVLLGAAIILVNGSDLSWNVDLPMLDFARSLYMESDSLSPLNPETYIRTTDYTDRLFLSLFDDACVELAATYTVATGLCDLRELIDAAARFGVRIYDDFVAAYPAARASSLLAEWYPLDAMQRTLER